MKGTALSGATKRVHVGETRAQGRSVTRAQWTVARPSRRLHRVSRTRIFGESQSSPTTTKKRTTGPPMTPPKDPNEGGGGGGGWGGNIARNVALNLGFLGLWMFLDSTGGGGGFFQGGGNFGGGGGGNGGGGGGGGSGGSGGGPSEPTFKIRELGDSDEEDSRQKRGKGRTKGTKQQRRKKLSVT